MSRRLTFRDAKPADVPAIAGAFCEKCGFIERGRVVYKGNPLVYYELRLDRGASGGDGELTRART